MKKGDIIRYNYNGEVHTGVIVANDTCLKHSSVFQVLEMNGSKVSISNEYLISDTMIEKRIGKLSDESFNKVNRILISEHGIGRNHEKKEISKGDIFYATLPKIGSTSIQSGRRPVIIATATDKIGDSVRVIPFTTQKKNKIPTHFSLMLAKPSTALCEAETSIPVSKLEMKIGSLSHDKMKEMDKCICVQHGIKNN